MTEELKDLPFVAKPGDLYVGIFRFDKNMKKQFVEGCAYSGDSDIGYLTIAALSDALEDTKRLTKELDIALHGEENAAEQASLCDLIQPAKTLRERVAELEETLRIIADCHVDDARPMTDVSYIKGLADSALDRESIDPVSALIINLSRTATAAIIKGKDDE